MEFKEEDYLQLAGIQHFSFCRRQWALIHLEQQWEENQRTIEGQFEHEICHDAARKESRGKLKISRAMPVFSRELGISGECDVVEFHQDDHADYIKALDGNYRVYPVEYKHGEPKKTDEDILQLTAQVMCLEEMLLCEIHEAALYYEKTNRRERCEITDELRTKVRNITAEMHQYMKRGYTPKVKPSKACNACSLKELCMPKLMQVTSAERYMRQQIEGDDE
jgi:CRISPR-associated exonuclease Cas4